MCTCVFNSKIRVSVFTHKRRSGTIRDSQPCTLKRKQKYHRRSGRCFIGAHTHDRARASVVEARRCVRVRVRVRTRCAKRMRCAARWGVAVRGIPIHWSCEVMCCPIQVRRFWRPRQRGARARAGVRVRVSNDGGDTSDSCVRSHRVSVIRDRDHVCVHGCVCLCSVVSVLRTIL